MVFFTLLEVLDAVIISFAVGFIFSGFFQKPKDDKYDPLKTSVQRFHWDDIKFAALVTAPGIILHELGHKFVALAFGMTATFHAAYIWLGVGVALKLLSFPFIFFVPAFVSIGGSGTYLQHSLVAFAGPAINLLIFFICLLYEKFGKVPKKYRLVIFLTSRINLFLFVFNMLPIPMFDGWGVYSNLFHAFGL